MSPRSWIPLVAVALSCGGRSQEPPSDAVAGSGGTSAGSGGTSAGTGGTGGKSGVGGASGSSGSGPACTGNPRSGCLRSCAMMGTTTARCVEGEWQCPDGVFSADCPPDSCGLSRGDCCDPTTGHLSGSGCSDDGSWQACVAPSVRNPDRAACIPDYLGITDCHDIDGQACENADHECNNRGGCRFSCRCVGTDGGLVWHCVLPVC